MQQIIFALKMLGIEMIVAVLLGEFCAFLLCLGYLLPFNERRVFEKDALCGAVIGGVTMVAILFAFGEFSVTRLLLLGFSGASGGFCGAAAMHWSLRRSARHSRSKVQ